MEWDVSQGVWPKPPAIGDLVTLRCGAGSYGVLVLLRPGHLTDYFTGLVYWVAGAASDRVRPLDVVTFNTRHIYAVTPGSDRRSEARYASDVGRR